MTGLGSAARVEALKAVRSKVPWLTALAFSLAPLMGGLFMFVLEDPERARTLGILGTKAQLVAGEADWPTYLSLLAQATAIGGALLFSLVTAWVFGREWADGTLKELLALPTPRWAVVCAKLLVVGACSLALTGVVLAVGIPLGWALGLPGLSGSVLGTGIARVVASAALTLALMPAVAFFASAGRGYLAPLGWALLTVFLAQILAALGWGTWFPWAVPAFYAGVAGAEAAALAPHAYVAVGLAGVAGVGATLYWWDIADV